MSEKRAKTLEALSAFIESQKALLARTKSDVVRIASLREDIASQPAEACSFSSFSGQWQALSCVGLSEDAVVPNIHKEIDWPLFSASDPAPFRALVTQTREAYTRQHQPSTKQTSPLSPLQQMVKAARASIVDPILPILASIPPPDPEDGEPLDPEGLRRIQERQKIRELKMRKIHGDVGFYGLSGLALCKPGSEAVFVRRDQADESAEVDIGFGGSGGKAVGKTTGKTTPSSALDLDMDADTPATSIASPQPVQSTELPAAPSRSRRQTTKAAAGRASQASSTPKNRTAPPSSPPPTSTDGQNMANEAPKLDKKGKPRPETYKQAWSVSEQHLLERLLEEIPEGERNRWAKISQAMDGKRTPRQVASRVQKYYEKLKRFGVEVGKGGSRVNDS